MISDDLKRAINETTIEMNNALKKDLENNIHSGLQFNGAPVKPLSKSWIKQKGHSIPFLWKGLLYKSVRDRKVKNGFEITISSNRSNIAAYLQRERPFFGFTKTKGLRIINESIDKGFKNF